LIGPIGFLILLAPLGCRQQMAEQPRLDPLEASLFFADGQSSRPPVEGTVARGYLRDDVHLYTGRLPDDSSLPSRDQPEDADDDEPRYADTFPLKVSEAQMRRGQDRYMIYCVVCHGAMGDGDGRIVERGFTKPPSLRRDRSRGFARRGKDVLLKDAPVGYLFDVITNGFGAMPDYAAQVPVEDRWAIIAYLRVLQATDLGANE
jgi:mono/diheme cytochrome c family protein